MPNYNIYAIGAALVDTEVKVTDSFLAEHRCDLVVVGTKGLTGSKRLRLGSVADYLAHHVRSSILIVRDTYPTM